MAILAPLFLIRSSSFFAVSKDKHNISNEIEFQPGPIMD